MSKKPPTGGEKPSRRKSRSSKAVSSTVKPNPTTGQSALSNPQLTTSNLPSDGTNARKQPAAPSAQALKTRDDDQRSHDASVPVTEPSLRSPHEKSAMANQPLEPEPAAPGHEKAKEEQKVSDTSPSVAGETRAQKTSAPVQDSAHPSLASEAPQDKRNVINPVNPRLPLARSEGEAAGVSVKTQRQIAQGTSASTTSPTLVTPGSSSATSPGLRREGIPSQGVQVERPQLLTQDNDVRFRTAPATSAAVSAPLTLPADGKAKTQTATWNACAPATRATAGNAVMVGMPAQLSGIKQGESLKKKLAMAFVAAGIVAGIITLALLMVWHHPLVMDKNYCTTEECDFHVAMLTAHLDKNIDPCENFSAYVCSAWVRSNKYTEFVKTPVDHMLFSRFIHFNQILTKGTKKLPAGEKARTMYKVCMSTDIEDKGNIESLTPLMEAVGLSWPEQRVDNKSALGVSLALAYRWHLPLWVSVEVPLWRKNAKWRLHIKPGNHIPLLWDQYESVRSGGVYTEYWHGFYSAFRTNATRPLNESSIEAIADAEGDVLERLQNSYASRKRNPAVVPLAWIGNFSAPLTSSTWLEQLNLELELKPPVLADHDVITSDTGFLTTLGDLFQNYTNDQLLGQLAWSFVQFCAPAVDRQLHIFRYGGRWKANAYKPIFCAFRVEQIFKLVVSALDYVSRLTEEDQLFVNKGYSSLISAMIAMLNSSTWLDEKSREVAADKVASIKSLLWPASRWLSNQALGVLYSEYPSDEKTFGDFWISARFAIASHNRTDDFEAAHSMPSNIGPPNLDYDYVLNNIVVPIGIVNRPLYYRRGTKAMFYGGLGFLMALEIVCALDKMGIHWTKDGQKVTSMLSPVSMQIFDAKDSCLKDEGIETVFPEIPALEVAYFAMEHAIRTDKDSLHVQGFSEEKVFFMTICYMACTSPTVHSVLGANCNKIVQNSPIFQTTFNCARDSKMNPSKKCFFFG